MKGSNISAAYDTFRIRSRKQDNEQGPPDNHPVLFTSLDHEYSNTLSNTLASGSIVGPRVPVSNYYN